MRVAERNDLSHLMQRHKHFTQKSLQKFGPPWGGHMTAFVSLRPGGDPKFFFSSCKKERLECMRDTALRLLIKLVRIH